MVLHENITQLTSVESPVSAFFIFTSAILFARKIHCIRSGSYSVTELVNNYTNRTLIVSCLDPGFLKSGFKIIKGVRFPNLTWIFRKFPMKMKSFGLRGGFEQPPHPPNPLWIRDWIWAEGLCTVVDIPR